jgi:tetraprenyl-beta-curcumene synthase
MGAYTYTSDGRASRGSAPTPGDLLAAHRRPPQPLRVAAASSPVVARHLALVLPQASRELAHWRRRAQTIPNLRLRNAAGRALAKRGNVEGAALLATLAPAAQRRPTVTALVAFQTAYNYLDALSELPSDDPIANGDQLHQALLTALHADAPHPDYYALHPDRGDGGYIDALVDACSAAVAGLPSFATLAPTLRCAAARIVDFQALNLSERQGGQYALKQWAGELGPAHDGLAWWESAAAAGSSLAVHALIAAAADPHLDGDEASAIDRAYHPWVGALHSLLDSLVDRREDHQRAHRSLLEHYRSPAEAANRLSMLAARARAATERLHAPATHRTILIAMCSYYLSAPECDTAEAQAVTRALTRTLGPALTAAIAMFRARRLLNAATRRVYV